MLCVVAFTRWIDRRIDRRIDSWSAVKAVWGGTYAILGRAALPAAGTVSQLSSCQLVRSVSRRQVAWEIASREAVARICCTLARSAPCCFAFASALARAICAALSDALRLTKERQTACKKTTDRTGSSAMWLLSWRRWSICTAALP